MPALRTFTTSFERLHLLRFALPTVVRTTTFFTFATHVLHVYRTFLFVRLHVRYAVLFPDPAGFVPRLRCRLRTHFVSFGRTPHTLDAFAFCGCHARFTRHSRTPHMLPRGSFALTFCVPHVRCYQWTRTGAFAFSYGRQAFGRVLPPRFVFTALRLRAFPCRTAVVAGTLQHRSYAGPYQFPLTVCCYAVVPAA